MKIALCLSGQPRYLKEGFSSIYPHLLSRYNNIDVFSHIWFDKTLSGNIFDFGIDYNRRGTWSETADKEFCELYNPTKCIFETQKTFDVSSLHGANFGKGNPHNSISQFYSLMKANELKRTYELENNFIYDVVIRARTDLVITTFNLKFEKLDLNFLHCCGTGTKDKYGIEQINDQFGFGNSQIMDTYSNIYTDYLDIWNIERLEPMVNECVLTYFLHKNSIPIKIWNESMLSNSIIIHM